MTTNVLGQFSKNLKETSWGDLLIDEEEAPVVENDFTPVKGKRGKQSTFAPKKMPKNVAIVGEPSKDKVAKKLSFEKKKANLGNNPFKAFAEDSE